MAGNKNKKFRLEDIPKKNPYQVPKRYFGSFNDRLMEKIRSEEKKPVKTFRLILRSNLALAASLLAFALISYLGFSLITGGKIDANSQNLTYTEFLEEEIYSLDEELLLDAYEQIDNSVSESIENGESEDYSEEIIQYLSAEDIDLSLIYEEL